MQQDLDGLTRDDLLARASELDVQGRSKMTKPELVQAIADAGTPTRRGRKIS
jgi:hypothetical protein